MVYWNKIYKSELLKTAYRSMDDFRCSTLDDNFEDFYIGYHATSMLGVPTEPLFIHYRGRGGWAETKISLKKFKDDCSIIHGVPLMKNFLEREGTFEEQEKFLDAWIYRVIMNDLCNLIYTRRIKDEDAEEATKILASRLMEWSDPERTTRYLLSELRNRIKSTDWLRSQVNRKDAIIADLEQNSSLKRLFKRKVKNRLRRIADRIFPKGTRSREVVKSLLRKFFPKRFARSSQN